MGLLPSVICRDLEDFCFVLENCHSNFLSYLDFGNLYASLDVGGY